MIDNLEEFIKAVEGFDDLWSSERCDYFVYYLTEIKNAPGVKPKDIELCFSELRMQPYSNISQHLKNNSRKNQGRFQSLLFKRKHTILSVVAKKK